MYNSKYISKKLKNIPVVQLNPSIVNGTYTISSAMKKKIKTVPRNQENDIVRLNPLLFKVSKISI
jgi:hypothetical protein